MTEKRKIDFIKADLRERILKQQHLQIACKLPIEAFELHVDMDRILREMLLRLQYDFYEENIENLEEKVTIEVYESWWDHFKATHAPEWFRELCPVRTRLETRVVLISAKARYPNFRPLKDQEVVIVRETTHQPLFP